VTPASARWEVASEAVLVHGSHPSPLGRGLPTAERLPSPAKRCEYNEWEEAIAMDGDISLAAGRRFRIPS
jgi:hypothetical protein